MSETSQEQHIIDTLIEERALKLRQHPRLWKAIRRVCKNILSYDKAVAMADDIAPMNGYEVFEYMSQLLQLDVRSTGIKHVPKEGAAFVTPNHPAGIADGIAVWDVLKEVRNDVCFVANRDAIRVAPAMADRVLPVEWREAERTVKKSREAVRAIVSAIRDERLIVLFPSGRLARPTIRGLQERPWQTTALSFASKHDVPVVPMHIRGHNTTLYYATWYINNELKDMTLFRELLNKTGKSYEIQLGKAVRIEGDFEQATLELRDYVLNDLKNGSTQFEQNS